MSSDEDVTEILLADRRGEPGSRDALFELVYEELGRIAHRQLSRNAALPLATTSLVHETYLKLVDQSRIDWQDRSHFLNLAAQAMRQVIVDFARRFHRKKRGGGKPDLPLDAEAIVMHADAEAVLAVDEVLGRLETLEPRLARIVELRFFSGFSEEETAELQGVSVRTVQRDWMRAKAWLREALDSRPTTPTRI